MHKVLSKFACSNSWGEQSYCEQSAILYTAHTKILTDGSETSKTKLVLSIIEYKADIQQGQAYITKFPFSEK